MTRPVIARASGIAAAALVVALLTALVFLAKAGAPDATNWPITFELRSSDNGVLFQFAQDVFAGRPLDWSFSPQVFVFPEIPISLLSYAIGGGSVQVYYLIVAAINNALLFLGLLAIVGRLFPTESTSRHLARSSVAMLPLLLLPLLGTTWLFEYNLAPTYYYGEYLLLIVAPLLVLARRPWVRIVLGVGIALTAASNPLALVFAVPATIAVGVVVLVARGWRAVARGVVMSVGVLVLALVIRLAFFGHLEGESPLAYISADYFQGRIVVIQQYLQAMLGTTTTAVVLVVGIAVVVIGFVTAVVLGIRAMSRRRIDVGVGATIYYALIPVGGLAATLVLLITDYLYLWPMLILPLVFALLPLPRRWVIWATPVALLALVAAAVGTGAVTELASAKSFFTYRSPQTQCLDEKLPAGHLIGYATFSDARQLELTSRRGFRLIQLKSSGVRAYWLTNRAYARDDVGTFFYIDDHGDEPAISTSFIESHFGAPDSSFSCGDGLTVLLYDDPAKLAKIKQRYVDIPAPGE